MLLLLLAGAGMQVPITNGVRAHAAPSFALVGGATTRAALVHGAADSMQTVVDATPAED